MRNWLLVMLTALSAALASGCAVHHHHHRVPQQTVVKQSGPPPHAPAHGYRHRHGSPHGQVELVFDSGLGVYLVVDLPNHYFHRDRYLKHVEGVWYASPRLDRDWVVISARQVPSGLIKHHAKSRGKKRGRAKHPAKHDY